MNIQPLQPVVTADFPDTRGDNQAKIPHILHQTWKEDCLTEDMANYIKTFSVLNPTWKYYFWTDESGRELIAKRHPLLLDIWDNVHKGVQRGDILRYVILYEFGGMYADLDVEFLRPLDRLTNKYSCVLSPEPFEHSVFLYKLPFVINQAIMLCKPKHPFFKMLIDNLGKAVQVSDVMDSTGPKFITNIFQKYTGIDYNSELRTDNSVLKSEPYFYYNFVSETDERHIYVPNTHYLLDELNRGDNGLPRIIQNQCYDIRNAKMLIKKGCVEVEQKGLYRKNTDFAYTRHDWVHTWLHPLAFKNLVRSVSKCQSIENIVPDRYMYDSKLDAPVY